MTPDNLGKFYEKADGFIVGSYFKKEGDGNNFVDEERVKLFMNSYRS